jgi:general stress protein 26
MTLNEQILEVMGGEHVGAVATVDAGMPAVRFMTLLGQNDLTLVGATTKSSRKVQQLLSKPDVVISIWSCNTYTDPYVVIWADAEMIEDIEIKEKYWNERYEQYFQSADSPEYVLITFTPRRIEYYDPGAMTMKVWEPKEEVPVPH